MTTELRRDDSSDGEENDLLQDYNICNGSDDEEDCAVATTSGCCNSSNSEDDEDDTTAATPAPTPMHRRAIAATLAPTPTTLSAHPRYREMVNLLEDDSVFFIIVLLIAEAHQSGTQFLPETECPRICQHGHLGHTRQRTCQRNSIPGNVSIEHSAIVPPNQHYRLSSWESV